jgi:hypothetical protein
MADSVAHIYRWRVNVTLTLDPTTPRRFYLRGNAEQINARIGAMFPGESYLLSVEPAPVQRGPEVFDRRLSVPL